MARLTAKRRDMLASMMKDGIYDAAMAVLDEYGFEGMTMDRVAESAGIAKGSLYNYFHNKSELILFVHSKTVEPAKQAADRAIEKSIPAVEKLTEALHIWFRHFAAHRAVFESFFHNKHASGLGNDPRQREQRDYAIDRLRVIVEQGIEEGVFRPLDAGRMAELLFGLIMVTFDQQIICRETRPIEESIDTLMDVFLRGVHS